MSLANITVTLANTNVSVSETTNNVTVSSTSSNIVVGNTAVITNSQIRGAISNTLPITYNTSTGVIGFDSNLDDLTLKKYQETVISNGNQSGDVSYNITNGTIHKATLTGNLTGITLSSMSAGGSATIILTQDAIGGHTLDLTTTPSNWTSWEFVDDYTTLSGTASTGIDIITVTYDGSKYFASVVNFQNVAPTSFTTSGNIETTGGFFLGDGGLLSNISGDISSVTAGTGLTGGGSSGAVTLNVGAGTGITANPDNVAVDMSAFSTSDLSEGTNLYYTTARANSAILDYDGALTPSTLTATGNIEGAVIKGTSIAISGDSSITGNLNVTGNINSETVTDLFVEDRNITMQYGQTGTPSANSQIFVDRGSESNSYIKWDENGDAWKFSNDGSTEYAIPASTSDLAEGTNQYFTTARVDTHLNTDAPVLYQSNSSGNPIVIRHTASDITLDAKNNLNLGADDANVVITTSNGSETMLKAKGVGGKLFLGPGQEDAALSSIEMTTSVIDVIGNLNVANTSVFGTLSSNANITTSANVSGAYLLGDGSAISNLPAAPVTSVNGATGVVVLDTADIAEDTNLYFTAARARGNISVGTPASASGGGSLAYNSGTGVFTFTPADTQTDSEVRALLSVGTPATPSGNGSLAYDNSTGVFTLTPADVPDTTDELTEGSTNLYYTSARADADIADYTGAIINMTGNLTTTANISADTVLADHVISDAGQPLQLKGQTNGIQVDKTISSTESRIFDADTTGYSISEADYHNAAVTTDNVPAMVIQVSGTSGSTTLTAETMHAAGLYAIGQQGTGYTNFGAFGQPSLQAALGVFGANLKGWFLFDVAGLSTTSLGTNKHYVAGISGNTITLSENLLKSISSGSVIMFPGAFSTTQNIGMSITSDTTNSLNPFNGTVPRYNDYTLPGTLSNVTLDAVSYGSATVDLANVNLRHSADLDVGTNDAIRTERLLLIGANATPDVLSIGTSDTLPGSTALGLTLENDGDTYANEVNTAPQMKFLMNQYTENALSSFSTYPLWTEFLGESGDANVDMKYLGAPQFNFKLLGGKKTDKKPVKTADVLGRIGWNSIIPGVTSGADVFHPPASIVARAPGDDDAPANLTLANADLHLQSTYSTSFRNGANATGGTIPRTFISSSEGNTVIAAKTDGKVTLRPVRDYGDTGTDTSFVENRFAHKLHDYHEFLGAGFLGTKTGTLVEIQPKSGETGGSANFNYDSKGNATLRISTHEANNTVKKQWDITNEQSSGNLVIRDHTNSTNVMHFDGSRVFIDESLRLQNLSTTDINAIASPQAGDVVYNTTLNQVCFYNGTAWQKITSATM